eukprot:m.174653 g.174653  ORF g.174653 m.174653 type:complete len:481 (-) comp25280_c4_seq5:55-1497(-)
MFSYKRKDDTPRKQVKRRRKGTERVVTKEVQNTVPESELYMQLLDFEKRLDSTLGRKRADVIESLKRPREKTKRVLRLFLSHSYDTLEPASRNDLPTWTFRLDGKLMDNSAARTNNKNNAKLSEFINRIYIEGHMGREPQHHPDYVIEWSKGNDSPDVDGFEISRPWFPYGEQMYLQMAQQRLAAKEKKDHEEAQAKKNSTSATTASPLPSTSASTSTIATSPSNTNNPDPTSSTSSSSSSSTSASTSTTVEPMFAPTPIPQHPRLLTLKVFIYLDSIPTKYRLHESLKNMLGLHTATRATVLAELWQYIKAFKQSEIKLADLQDLITKLLFQADPVVLTYEISPNSSKKRAAYDVQVEVDETARAQANLALLTPSSQEELRTLDAEVTERVQQVDKCRARRDFLVRFADDPKSILSTWFASQSRDTSRMTSSSLLKEEQRSAEFYCQPWAQEAVFKYFSAKMGEKRTELESRSGKFERK